MTFQVEAEDLTAHASHLEALTDRVDTAISAAEQAMSDDAYGLLCSFLPPIISPMEQEGMDALKAVKEGITTTAENVRQTAKEYQETDQAGADNFSQFDDAVRVKESAVALRGVVPAAGPAGGTAPVGFSSGSDAPTGFSAPSGRIAPEGPEMTDTVRTSVSGSPAQQGTPMYSEPMRPTQQGTPAYSEPVEPLRPASYRDDTSV
ncbi:type VII secretion target [Saccharopolyspora hirsuta]|uniref:ESX-1 secretion-associated protein n=1 Tax=Saccharopolyspora hirsuta TaxID=1837 RepID=A0A5M7C1H8_SACHI|nr:type VII secretion target [Saccharopolyspora hirsuta]KAA5836296.1 hypothetical protein F1721_08290 [Saccharopolyspora hirsuta]